MLKKQSSLKSALQYNFILLGVLPALFLGVSALILISRSLSSEITTKNQILAASLSGEVEIFLKEPLSLLGQVNSILEAETIVNDGAINAYLDTVVANYQFFEMIQYVDQSGKVVNLAPYSHDYIGTDMSRQVFFKNTLNSDAATWSKTFISMQSGDPTLTLSIPACKGGILVGYLNLHFLNSIVQKFSGEHAYAVITDQEGTIIAEAQGVRVQRRANLRHLEPVRQGMAGKFGTSRVTDDGENLILNVVNLPLTNWLILYFQHYDYAFSPVRNMKEMLFIGAFGTALVAFLIALLGARLILSPLARLMDSAKRIAAGDYNTALSHQQFTEFQQLDENFHNMAGAIQVREENIRESERVHRKLIEAIPYGIQEVNTNGIIVYANSAFDRIFGYPPGSLVGKPIWFTEATPEKQEALREFLVHITREMPPPATYYTQANTATNRVIDLQIDWQYKHDPDGELLGFISVVTDITERKQLEENLRQAQKMEAIGTLAGGIAHDFNNILAAIMGYSELVLDDLPYRGHQYENQQQVIKACHRARDLVQHLLIFSRKQEHNKSPVEIHVVINEALQLLRATLPSTIDFSTEIDAQCGVIEGNATQVHQIILNLCTNAAHAMQQEGGTLRVSLTPVEIQPGDDISAIDTEVGKYAKITIADTGKGIVKENLGRIFDPFFTTKKTGEGTGMGLAVVHGIVKSHSGHIRVESTPDNGTTFEVLLPLILSPAIRDQENTHIIQGDGEHILVVDDEQAIVNYTDSILSRMGYSVSTATDSTEALEIFAAAPQTFDLVITDQTMPIMTGFEMAQKMLATRPSLPVILCSGYSETVTVKKALQKGIKDYVMKPLNRQLLSQKVGAALGKTYVTANTSDDNPS